MEGNGGHPPDVEEGRGVKGGSWLPKPPAKEVRKQTARSAHHSTKRNNIRQDIIARRWQGPWGVLSYGMQSFKHPHAPVEAIYARPVYPPSQTKHVYTLILFIWPY